MLRIGSWSIKFSNCPRALHPKVHKVILRFIWLFLHVYEFVIIEKTNIWVVLCCWRSSFTFLVHVFFCELKFCSQGRVLIEPENCDNKGSASSIYQRGDEWENFQEPFLAPQVCASMKHQTKLFCLHPAPKYHLDLSAPWLSGYLLPQLSEGDRTGLAICQELYPCFCLSEVQKRAKVRSFSQEKERSYG